MSGVQMLSGECVMPPGLIRELVSLCPFLLCNIISKTIFQCQKLELLNCADFQKGNEVWCTNPVR